MAHAPVMRGGSNAPCRGTKASLWEGGIRVPCIIRWPDRIKPGQRSKSLASSIDLLPSLAAVCGGELSENTIDGVDIQSLFTDSTTTPREEFAYYWRDQLHAVRSGPWKLFLCDGVGDRQTYGKALYNLIEDVGETTDVQDQHPDIVAKLEKLADQVRADLGCSQKSIEGSGRRSAARVEDAKPLTEYDPEHPYICAMYDCMDGDVWAG